MMLFCLVIVMFSGILYGGFRLFRHFFTAEAAPETIVPPKDVTAENVSSDHTKQIEQIRNAHALDTVSVTGLSDEEIRSLFYSSEIDDKLLSSMQGSTWSDDQNFIRPEQLRYIRVLYKNFDGNTAVGEIIMNESLAEETEEIFYDLYMHDYPIERMILPDAYGGNDTQSMENNNTSGFTLRLCDGVTLWPHEHALGLAIDLNPFYNPFVVRTANEQSVSPASAETYADRTNIRPYMIDKNDYAYQLLTSHGFTWGGDWTERTDYQHFEKNYTPPETLPDDVQSIVNKTTSGSDSSESTSEASVQSETETADPDGTADLPEEYEYSEEEWISDEAAEQD